MDKELIIHILIMEFGVGLSAVSQVLLKIASTKIYKNKLMEYLNFNVIFAYSMFVIATIATIFAYRVVPLSMGPIIEASGYIYVLLFGHFLFKEKINNKQIIGVSLIILGIFIFAFI